MGSWSGTSQGPRTARLVPAAWQERRQRGEKAERAAGALKVGDGGPALAHEVYKGRVEGVGGADAVAEFDAFLIGLSLLGGSPGVGAAHGGDDFLVGGSGWGGIGLGGHFAQQAALDDAENFVAFDRLAALVFAGGEVVNGLEQVDVVEGLAFAGLEREHQHALGGVADGDGEALDEAEGFVAQGGVEDFDTPGADEVFEDFVQEDEVGLVSEDFDDVIGAGRDAPFVVFAKNLVAGRTPRGTRRPSPRGCSPCLCRRGSPFHWRG